MNNKLKVLDLFSGIGGFSLGLHSTGIFDTIKFVEFDEFCQKILNKNFPNIPIEGDIRNVRGKEFEADVITGGIPCQPFSVAGKQKGTNDNRYLWPEMFRLIKEIKPEFVIGENVQGIINLQNGMVLRQVQDQLEGEGFEVQCFLIPASGIGAWHQRNRVWIVAHSKHNGYLAAESRSNAKKNKDESKDRKKIDSSGKFIRTNSNGKANQGYERNNVPNTISQLSAGCSSTTRDSGEEFIRLECSEGWYWQKVRSKTKRCSEQVMANTESKGSQGCRISTDMEAESRTESSKDSFKKQYTWWEIERKLCGVPNGISYELDKTRSLRIKSLGNAIVPQIARILGLAIKKVLNQEV